MKKFEYLVECDPNGYELSDKRINELGLDRWELVTIYRYGEFFRYVFKREILT